MNSIVLAIVLLGVIAALSSVILYLVSKKFAVYEDPKIGEVQEALPGANCGACGFPGCAGFAEACATAESLEGLSCPVGGSEVMTKVSFILGKEAEAVVPKLAVLLCNGSCENRPQTNVYDGAPSCFVASSLYGGETACSYGCLGLGDCVVACTFDAIHINPETGLPEVVEDKCTACGACVLACPKDLLELRKKGPKSRRIYVQCKNEDKGAQARKACTVACIACTKCEQVCAFDAITISNNVAYINDDACRLCRKCVEVCPTNSIIELNFPPKKVKKTEDTLSE